jgi:hypothetical protein
MEPIDIYNSFDKKRAQRIGRNAKIIYKVAKFGRKGLKANPATVYVDAVISVGEAVVAFYQYQQAKEITKQLKVELKTLRHQISNKQKEFEAIENTLNIDLTSKVELNKKELDNIKEKWTTHYKPIYEYSKKYLFRIKKKLEIIRKEYPDSEQLQQLEIKFKEAIESHISASLFII